MTAGIVPIGLSIAAALTSIYSQNVENGHTAWIVTAIVGTTSMIAAAAAARDRRPPRDHEPEEADSRR